MTNITREQIERQKWAFKIIARLLDLHNQADREHDWKKIDVAEFIATFPEICALALRALDTPSVEDIEAKAYERVANFHSQVSVDLRRNGKLELAEDLELFARTLRNVNLLTTRYVELPEGHVVVPVEPTKDMIKAGEGAGNYWSQGADNIYRAMIGEVK